MTADQAQEMIDWLRTLFAAQLIFGAVILVVLVALAVVHFWRGG